MWRDSLFIQIKPNEDHKRKRPITEGSFVNGTMAKCHYKAPVAGRRESGTHQASVVLVCERCSSRFSLTETTETYKYGICL